MSVAYSYRPDVWPALVTLALVIFLGAYSWRRRSLPAPKPFTVACMLGGFWTLGVVLQISAADFPTKVFWVKFQAIWQLPVATTVTCFLFQYAGLGRWLTRRAYALLYLFPLLSVALIVTNGFHHLIWTGFQANGNIAASTGRLFWIIPGYIYLLGLVNFAVLIRLAIRSPGHRWPVAIILAAQIVGRIVYTADKLGVEGIGPGEFALFSIGLVGVAYAIALLRFHAIDPVAAARTVALEQMKEGLFVLDLQGRIVDANPTAAEISGIPEQRLRNAFIEKVLPIDAEALRQLEHTGHGQTEITLGKEDSARQYTLHWTTLRGRHGEVVGQLLLLHDVTKQRSAQTRLWKQQSVVAVLTERERLARELHDGIGQVLGYVSLQAQTVLKWVHDGNHEKAESLLRQLVEVAKDAHTDVRESILALKTGPVQDWSFVRALKEYVDKYQANYGIPTELSLSDGIDDDTFDTGAGVHLLRAIQETLANARKHSGAHTLKIRVKRDGNNAQISISDDGDGFDAGHFGRSDGDHFGLVFMRERMAQIGGSLSIESAPGRGTGVTLAVPIVSERKEAQ